MVVSYSALQKKKFKSLYLPDDWPNPIVVRGTSCDVRMSC